MNAYGVLVAVVLTPVQAIRSAMEMKVPEVGDVGEWYLEPSPVASAYRPDLVFARTGIASLSLLRFVYTKPTEHSWNMANRAAGFLHPEDQIPIKREL